MSTPYSYRTAAMKGILPPSNSVSDQPKPMFLERKSLTAALNRGITSPTLRSRVKLNQRSTHDIKCTQDVKCTQDSKLVQDVKCTQDPKLVQNVKSTQDPKSTQYTRLDSTNRTVQDRRNLVFQTYRTLPSRGILSSPKNKGKLSPMKKQVTFNGVQIYPISRYNHFEEQEEMPKPGPFVGTPDVNGYYLGTLPVDSKIMIIGNPEEFFEYFKRYPSYHDFLASLNKDLFQWTGSPNNSGLILKYGDLKKLAWNIYIKDDPDLEFHLI